MASSLPLLASCIALAACHRASGQAPVIQGDPVTSTRPSFSASASHREAPVASAVPPLTDRAWKACKKRSTDVPSTYHSVREVDWCNYEYLPGIATLTEGRAELHEYGGPGTLHDTDIFHLGSVAYGDLDGDGVEEAVVVLDHESYPASGGHHLDAEFFVFALRSRSVLRLASERTHVGSVARIRDGYVQMVYSGGCIAAWEWQSGALRRWSDPCVEIK